MIEVILVAGLAGARLWRLFVVDDAGAPVRRFRDRLIDKFLAPREQGPPIPEWRFNVVRIVDDMWECPWCLGFWLSALTVGLGVILPTWAFLLLAGPFAVNYISANLNIHLGDKDAS